MRKLSLVSLVLAATACTAQPAANQSGALAADPTARSFGIASYVIEGDNVRMIDQDGAELGSLAIRDTVDSRLIDVALTDGTTDQIQIYRPKADGSFFAPISRDYVAGAALGDAALASLFKAHAVTFHLISKSTRSVDAVAPADVASTTKCVGTAQNHNLSTCTSNCDWQSMSPAGCARPANLHAGCTNPTQLPAVITYNNLSDNLATEMYSSQSLCLANIDSWCTATLGAGGYNGTHCSSETPSEGDCKGHTSWNEWDASCPRVSCGTVGQYDSVPRLSDCVEPGSCTGSQGTVGCTAYH